MEREKAARHWKFEDGIVCLNHGSFGAVPLPVQIAENNVRQRLRDNAFDHLVFEHGGLLSQAHTGLMEENRHHLADLVHADTEGFVLTQGATDGVNAVFRSLRERGYFKPGDEILITSHTYNACANVAHETAALTGAKVVVADLPFPVESAGQIRSVVSNIITDKTKLAMIDHIPSIQAYISPIEDVVADMKARNVPVLVDGAHALAQVPLNLDRLGADFYVGNCHKWFCAPPGSGFLSVAPKWREVIHPTVLSHGYNDESPELSPLVKMFAWTGTRDYSSMFVLKEAHQFLDSLSSQGMWDMVASNRALVREGYGLLLDTLKQKPNVPEDMMGTMATVILPPCEALAVKQRLRDEHGFVTQLLPNAVNGRPILRISAHAYNSRSQYEKLAAALPKALTR